MPNNFSSKLPRGFTPLEINQQTSFAKTIPKVKLLFRVKNSRQSLTGFTLIELLVVIAIMGILAGVILLNMPRTSEKAKIANTMKYATTLRTSLQQDMVAWWKFDEGEGSTARDTWWNQNHGTIVGAQFVDGVMGKALSFNGSSYIRRNTQENDSLDIKGDFTISAWFQRFNSTRSEYLVVKNNTTGSDQQYSIYLIPTGVNAYLAGVASSWSLTWQNNQWYFIALTRKESNLNLYLNGKQILPTRIRGEILPFRPYFSIGARSNSTDGSSNTLYFYGLIDDVQIYDAALSQSAIEQLYAQGKDKYQPLASY